MAKYLLAYHGGGMPETEEALAASMAAWGAWMGGLGQALVDPGNPVGATTTVAADRSTSDGGGANPVTGYSIVEADSMASALDLARSCPILDDGGTVELCETFDAM